MSEGQSGDNRADSSSHSLVRLALSLLRPGGVGRSRRDEAQQQAMVKALQHPGCPICRPLAEAERKYFFWFLTENYSSAETFFHLVAAGGFCHAHSALLSGLSGSDNHAVAAAYHRLTARFVERIAGTAKRRKSTAGSLGIGADCPACASSETTARRQLNTMAAVIRTRGIAVYREPALLCGSHLKALLPRLPTASVDPMLTRQRQRLRELLDADASSDQLTSMLCVQSRAVGYPPAGGKQDRSRADAVTAFVQRLDATAECPVCVSERHAWQEWTYWLDNAPGEDEKPDGCLPVCITHVRALSACAGPALCLHAARHANRSVLNDIEAGLKVLRQPSRPPRRRQTLTQQFERLPWRRRRRLRKRVANAVRRVRETPRCPLCERLSDARRQSLRLLFTLLWEPHHRDRFRRGHGLCLRHLNDALQLHPDASVGETMRASCVTALELLGWELTQFERKQRWDNRPERKGREGDAWRRALGRFSGSMLSPETPAPALHVHDERQQPLTTKR